MKQIISQLGITRAQDELTEIVSLGEERGIRVVPLPLFHYTAVGFELTSSELARIDWLCFTSARGVGRFFETLKKQGVAVSPDTRFAVVGAKTATALQEYGFTASILPQTTVSEALFEELLANLGSSKVVGHNIIYVGAEAVRFDPVDIFKDTQVNYRRLIVYRAEEVVAPAEVVERFSVDDSILFTSPKAAERFATLFGPPKTRIVAIGEITAEAIEELGWEKPETLTEPDLKLALEYCLCHNSKESLTTSQFSKGL